MITVVPSGAECTGEGQLANLTNPIELLPKGDSHTCQLKSKNFSPILCCCWWFKKNRKNPKNWAVPKYSPHSSVSQKNINKKLLSFTASEYVSCFYRFHSVVPKERRTILRVIKLWMPNACFKPGLHSNSTYLNICEKRWGFVFLKFLINKVPG